MSLQQNHIPTEEKSSTVTEEDTSSKVLLFLRPVGGAPSLKKTKFKQNGQKSIMVVENYLRKLLGPEKSIYLYCGSSFSPTPDQILQDLYDCFQVDGELTITYGLQESWG